MEIPAIPNFMNPKRSFTQDDAQFIATDTIKARDSGGLALQNDGSQGLLIKDDGNIDLDSDRTVTLFSNVDNNITFGGASSTVIMAGALQVVGNTTLATLDAVTMDDTLTITASATTLLDINSSSTTADSEGFNVSHSGAITGTGYGGIISKTGASTTNVALKLSATGATNNYALIAETGDSGFGTTSPNLNNYAAGNMVVTIQSPTGANRAGILELATTQQTSTGLLGEIDFNYQSNKNASIFVVNDGATNSGKLQLATQSAGGGNIAWLIIDKDGVINIPNLTASSDVQTDGSKNLISTSDPSLKNDMGVIVGSSLSLLSQINGRYYSWKNDKTKAKQLGFYAPEVGKVIPEAAPYDKEKGLYGFNGRPLLAHLINGVNEHYRITKNNITEIAYLKNKIAELEARLN